MYVIIKKSATDGLHVGHSVPHFGFIPFVDRGFLLLQSLIICSSLNNR